MLTAVVTRGLAIEVRFVAAEEGDDQGGELMSFGESQDFCEFPYETEDEFEAQASAAHPCQDGPSPIAPEAKEIAWGAGSFIVLAVLMRYFLFPKVKAGMDARYSLIRDGHEQADASRASARAEVSEYESALATVKAEANERIDASRHKLETERAAAIEAANAAIAERRDAAKADVEATREAVRGDVVSAAADVAARTIELATGQAPDPAAVRSAVDQSTSAGVPS